MSHIDTFDPKPDRDVQGEFEPIKTSVPGVFSCLFAGGGVRGGQVIGSSDADGTPSNDRTRPGRKTRPSPALPTSGWERGRGSGLPGF